MLKVLVGSWAIFVGIFMLMIGNGMQGTLLGLRGEMEGFSTLSMSMVTSAYFVGFMVASSLAPKMIRRVGHVRVFAALASMISAIFVLYAIWPTPVAWMLERAMIGFCFCGAYIVVESWLNSTASNENRAQALSLYMWMQMAGIITSQIIAASGNVAGFELFGIASVIISLCFAPMLLTTSKVTPTFDQTKSLPLGRLMQASPLACAGMFLLGSVFAAQFGMAAIYGVRVGMPVEQITLMIGLTYVAALILQFPVGWLADRMDRRILIGIMAAIGGVAALLAFLIPGQLWLILAAAAVVGGTSNTVYPVIIAHANDYLEADEMPAASGKLLFINGLGSIAGPLILGWMMDNVGPQGFWLVVAVVMLALGVYAAWRLRRVPHKEIVGAPATHQHVLAGSSPVAVQVVAEAASGDGEENGLASN
ncbi:MFS-type transporter [Ketogulonicigenium robustum]|uniref:MFS-type transporter n=1 Tax=Ketogulonicigenium robustum TaxID=92947 RepID=A0A1W6P0Q6_9RHOB|nr:MFS transporter [Ketogulonicigenium robustum]ARO14910.1 MFS-type transporter [Ketogulonicigenium robustum]